MVELVVAAQSRQGPHAHAVGKEDLGGSVDPGLALQQLAPVHVDVVGQTVDGSGEGEGPAQQNKHDKVGEEGGEPDDLAGWVQTLGDDHVDNDPGEDQASGQLPL